MTLPICPQGHSIWSPPLDSNEHPPGPKPGDLPISPKGVSGANSWDRTRFTITYLVGGLGIEPNSTALQAVAEITRLAHPAKFYCTQIFQ